MSFAVSAVIIVGLFCVLNLLLMLGVLRRIREQQGLIEAMSGPPQIIKVGQEVGEFTTSTVEGEALTRDDIGADTVVAFFSPSCQPCLDKIPELVRYGQAMPDGRERMVAVVVGAPREARPLVAQLAPVARVVVEPSGGPVARAFQVSAFPTVLRAAPDSLGRVLVRDNRLDLGRFVGAAR